MLDSIKIGHFISEKRKELKMTQQQLADKLKVSFQAVSKWENGSAYPNLEVLYELSVALGVKVDDILSGCEKSGEGLSYSKAGIDITYTDTIKQEMAKHLETSDRRVLNGLGPFASLWRMRKCCGPSIAVSASSWLSPPQARMTQYAASPNITPAMKSEG